MTRYIGVCNRCGHKWVWFTPGPHACIWGGCNGTATPVRDSADSAKGSKK